MPKDQNILQADINNLHTWGVTWCLRFNEQKCKSISIHCGVDKLKHRYKIGEHTLDQVDNMDDLGILISNDLKWTSHISRMCKKAEKQLWLVIRTLSYQAPIIAKKTAYLAMVRSIIEYGSNIWSPKQNKSPEGHQGHPTQRYQLHLKQPTLWLPSTHRLQDKTTDSEPASYNLQKRNYGHHVTTQSNPR